MKSSLGESQNSAAYDFRAIRYIPGLDGVRAAAVTLVMLSHFGYHWVPGGLGVTIFFFLSGFLITTLMSQEDERNGRISIPNFYARRFIRLGPELLSLIVLSSVVFFFMGQGPSVGDVLAALTYTYNYFVLFKQYLGLNGFAHPFWPQLWSLGVEEHFYLTFPIVFVFVRKSKVRIRTFLGFVLISCLMWRTFIEISQIYHVTAGQPYTTYASEARFDSIAYGVMFAFLARTSFRIKTLASALALVCGLGLLGLSLVVRDVFFQDTLKFTVQGIAIFLIFAHLYLTQRISPLISLLEWRPIQLAGVLSYGAYLWHMEYLRSAELLGIHVNELGTLRTAAFAAGGIALTFLVAYASRKVIATPALKLRARFGSHAVAGI